MDLVKRMIAVMLATLIICATAVECVSASEESAPISVSSVKRDGPDERPWSAKWIWSKANTAKHNWLCLRKTVELGSVPSSASARISADSRYWLWINGEPVVYEGSVKRGPNATDCYFDEVELAPYLKKGTNTIAVLAWYFGDDSDYYSYKSSGKAGFLFEADMGESKVVSDKSWRVHKEDGYLISTESNDPGTQPNYRLAEGNILYDATLSEALEGWYLPDFDDSSWTYATEHGEAGAAPWGGLWQRSIPLLKYSDILDYENPDKYAAYTDKATAKTVKLDMKLPRNMQVQPYLEIEAPEGLRIEIKSDSDSSVRATYVTKEGRQTFESYGWMNGHSMRYTVPAGVKIIRLGYRATGYNTEFEGSFRCNDEFYNRLWDESLWTLYVTMRDNYMDCPDRERAQWWGDVTNESHMTFYALGTDSYLLYRKGVDTLINWRGQTGERNNKVLPTVVPINNGHFELPMQQLAGVVGFWTYYRYTGELDFVEQVYQPALDYLTLWELGEDGLVKHRAGSWDWPDHGENYDVAVMENAWYYWALDSVLNMAEVLGETKDRAYIIGRMQSVKRGFERFWDEENKAYYKSTANGLPDDRGNALAVLSGLAGKDRYSDIIEVLKEQYNATPYMEKYVLDAMFKMGYADEALYRMRERYKTMVEDNYTTLWEVFPLGGTNNHAWSGGPLINLSGDVAGVAPDTPGYDTYHVIPQLGTLKNVECTVPSIKGDITVDIDRTVSSLTLSLTSPIGTVARVGVPRFEGKNTTVTLGSDVIFEDGKAKGTVNGVKYLADDENYIYFNVQPGSYTFKATPKGYVVKDTYTLKIDPAAGGTVKVNGNAVGEHFTQTYSKGTNVILEAEPGDGYVFAGWSGTYGSDSSRLTLTMKDDIALRAVFEPAEGEYRLVTFTDPSKTGMKVKIDGVTYPLPTQYPVRETDELTVEAVDAVKWSFVNWQGDVFSADRVTTLKDLKKDMTLSVQGAYRKGSTMGGTLTVNGENGSVKINGELRDLPCTVTYDEETLVSIEPVADKGYAFIGWTGDITGRDRPIYVNMGGNVTLTADFKSLTDILFAPSANLALDKKASATSSYEAGAEWSVTNLTDGVTTSVTGDCGYSSNTLSSADIPLSERPSLEIDLGVNTFFNRLKLYPRTNMTTSKSETCNFPLSYEVQVKGDGQSEWKTVYTASDIDNPKGKAVSVDFDKQSARYIRIKVIKVSGNAADEGHHRVQLAEIEVYDVPVKPDDFEPEDVDEGKIRVTPDLDKVKVCEKTFFTAYVTPSALGDNGIVWSLENADGTASDIAMLIGAEDYEMELLPLKEGEAYLVARMTGGLNTLSKTLIEIDFDTDYATRAIVRIASIGDVTLEREHLISLASKGYYMLSEEEMAQVTNFDVLEAAEKKLQELKDEAKAYHTVIFMNGEEVYKEVSVKDGEGVSIPWPEREGEKFTEYQFVRWVDGYGNYVSLDKITEDMTLYAVYTAKCEHPFTDLKDDSYYTEAVEWALMNGVMNGTAATKFNPDGVTDRAMIVTVLYRLQGSPDVSHVKTPFTDVKKGEWYAPAIAWAYDNGVVNGNTATTFNPKGQLSREQFATILYRYAKEVEGQDVSVSDKGALDKYKDKKAVSNYALDALLWANVRGLIGGVSATKLSPGSGATRAQMATILFRYNSPV